MTDPTQIKAVYLPVKYEANAGEMLLTSIDEGIQVLTSDPTAVTVLPLPRADLYLLKVEQLNRDDDSNLNKAASIFLRESGLSNICVRGPALVVARKVPVLPD